MVDLDKIKLNKQTQQKKEKKKRDEKHKKMVLYGIHHWIILYKKDV